MNTAAAPTIRRLERWLLGGGTYRDVGVVAAVVVAYVVLDRLTWATTRLDANDIFASSLTARALVDNPLPAVLLASILTSVGLAGRGRLLARWSGLEHGNALRWLATPMLVVLVWYGAFYEYNYLANHWHTTDRLLVLALGIAAWYRPVFLVPLAIVARVMSGQFVTFLDSTAAENIGELVVVAVLVLAAMAVVAAATGEDESSAALLVVGAATAAHFFVPGLHKIRIDWAANTDVGDFALSSYTAGWLGSGDGHFATRFASAADTFRWPIVAGTLLLELGAVIALLNRRLLEAFLLGWIGLHVVIFTASGFWLFEWVAVELTLFVLLARRDLREWVSANATPARALLGAGLVLFGSLLFHPPRLAWLDAPASYGYEIEAVGESGAEYQVPLDAFAPFTQELAFGFAQFRPEQPAAGGYGAVGSTWELNQLAAAATFDDLRAIERLHPPVPEETREASETLVRRWLEHASAEGRTPWFLLTPPSRFWTSRPAPTWDFDEPLESVTVILVSSLHDGNDQRFERVPVLTVALDADGDATVVSRIEASNGG